MIEYLYLYSPIHLVLALLGTDTRHVRVRYTVTHVAGEGSYFTQAPFCGQLNMLKLLADRWQIAVACPVIQLQFRS